MQINETFNWNAIPEGDSDHCKVSHFLENQEDSTVFQSVYDANGSTLMQDVVNFTMKMQRF